MFTNLIWISINMRNKSKSSIYNRLLMARLLFLSKIADFCTTKIFFSLLFFASNYDSSRIRTKSNGWFHEWKYTQICSLHERETEKETPYQAFIGSICVCSVCFLLKYIPRISLYGYVYVLFRWKHPTHTSPFNTNKCQVMTFYM